MILTSPSFEDGGMIPKKFTCDGGDINPELIIQNVPDEARGLALIVHDPDAPMEGGFSHWVLWNIPPQISVIKQESVPPGAREGLNSRRAGYMGPCPPPGSPPHHYEFRLYALDTELDLQEDETSRAELESFMEGHILDHTILTGLYGRG